MIELVSPTTLDALAWTLIHFLWQGTVLGAAAFIALRIVRPERAATRYGIGVATLGIMLAGSVITFTLLSRPSASVSGAALAMADDARAAGPSEALESPASCRRTRAASRRPRLPGRGVRTRSGRWRRRSSSHSGRLAC
jgi:hypothetical protein